MVREISWVRRDIIALQRIVKPQIAIVANLEHKDRPFIREELDIYFSDVLDHLYKAWDMLEDHRDVIEGLSDTANTLTTYRINEVMKILTIISVIMLPLTLVSGIYGMNISLPLAQHPFSFVVILVLMAFIAGGMLFFSERGGGSDTPVLWPAQAIAQPNLRRKRTLMKIQFLGATRTVTGSMHL